MSLFFYLLAICFTLSSKLSIPKYKTKFSGELVFSGYEFKISGDFQVNQKIGKGMGVQTTDEMGSEKSKGIFCIDEKNPDYVCYSHKDSESEETCECENDPGTLNSTIDILKLLDDNISKDYGVVDCPESCGEQGKGEKCVKYKTLINFAPDPVHYYIKKKDGFPLCFENSKESYSCNIIFTNFTTNFDDTEFKYPFDPTKCD